MCHWGQSLPNWNMDGSNMIFQNNIIFRNYHFIVFNGEGRVERGRGKLYTAFHPTHVIKCLSFCLDIFAKTKTFDIWDGCILQKRILGEGPVWLQPNQQSLPSLPPGKLPHHVLPWSSHLEQQEGDFFQLSPQKEADFDGKEAEMNPHNNFVFGPETLCWSSFWYFWPYIVLPDECEDTKQLVAINNICWKSFWLLLR